MYLKKKQEINDDTKKIRTLRITVSVKCKKKKKIIFVVKKRLVSVTDTYCTLGSLIRERQKGVENVEVSRKFYQESGRNCHDKSLAESLS